MKPLLARLTETAVMHPIGPHQAPPGTAWMAPKHRPDDTVRIILPTGRACQRTIWTHCPDLTVPPRGLRGRVKLLAGRGADLNVRYVKGLTPLGALLGRAGGRRQSMVDLLRSRGGADLDEQRGQGLVSAGGPASHNRDSVGPSSGLSSCGWFVFADTFYVQHSGEFGIAHPSRVCWTPHRLL